MSSKIIVIMERHRNITQARLAKQIMETRRRIQALKKQGRPS